MKISAGGLLLLALISVAGLYFWDRRGEAVVTAAQKAEIQSILEFRQKAEARLRAPSGWLTIVGLTWLKEGRNTIGSSARNDVILPASAPAELGSIEFHKGVATLSLSHAAHVTVDAKPAELHHAYKLVTDGDSDDSQPTKIHIGSVTFWMIQRKNGVGVRMRDENAEALKKFKGRSWFEPDLNSRIRAKWVAFTQPQIMLMPDILGNVNEEKSPGYAEFSLNGALYQLHPTIDDGKLFFVFRDQTAGKETYGAARFLYTDLPQNGHVILDFNKAVNPPCAFTHYATCPMPPKQNILPVAIRAGELLPPGHE